MRSLIRYKLPDIQVIKHILIDKLAKTTRRFWLGYHDIFDKNKNKKVWGR